MHHDDLPKIRPVKEGDELCGKKYDHQIEPKGAHWATHGIDDVTIIFKAYSQ